MPDDAINVDHVEHRSAAWRTAIARCIAEIEAMPDFAGRTAWADGLTHECQLCGEWMTEDDVRKAQMMLVHLRVDQMGELLCGPVHNLGPTEGILRHEAVARLRALLKSWASHPDNG